MKNVSIIGAGNVGATAALLIAQKLNEDEEITLIDINTDVVDGKATDIDQAGIILGFGDGKVLGTDDIFETQDSDVVVITAGVPRKPGMTREELVGVNSEIVKNILLKAYELSPNATFVIVSNPMDTMTWMAHKILPVPHHKIIGVGGILDSARFKYYTQGGFRTTTSDESRVLNLQSHNEDSHFVIGGHGDTTMIPLRNTVAGYQQGKENDDLWMDNSIEETMCGGATITKLIGTSAWVAPAAAISVVVDSILHNKTIVGCCSVYLEDKDVCVGLPCEIGENGIQSIVYNLNLTEEEKEKFEDSIKAIKKVNESVKL